MESDISFVREWQLLIEKREKVKAFLQTRDWMSASVQLVPQERDLYKTYEKEEWEDHTCLRSREGEGRARDGEDERSEEEEEDEEEKKFTSRRKRLRMTMRDGRFCSRGSQY